MKPRKRKQCPRCKGTLNLIGECLLCEMFQTGQVPGGQLPGVWPRKSTTLACHRSQIPAIMERNKKHGLNVRYDDNGRPEFDGLADKAKLVRIERQYLGKDLSDYDAGYGDA